MATMDQKPRYRILKTLAAYSANVCMALGTNIIGPTLLSMGYLLGTDTTHMALSLAALRLGYLAGTVTCGLIFSSKFTSRFVAGETMRRVQMRAELQFALCGLGIAAMLIMAPWQQHVYAFIAAILLKGIAVGYIDTGLQVYVMNLWTGHRSRNTILQGMHLEWSVCATILPYFISLFLRDIPGSHSGYYDYMDQPLSTTTNSTLLDGSYNDLILLPNKLNNSTTDSVIVPLRESRESPEAVILPSELFMNNGSNVDWVDDGGVGLVRWAYVTLAGLAVLNSLFVFTVYLITRHDGQNYSHQHSSSNPKKDDYTQEKKVSVPSMSSSGEDEDDNLSKSELLCDKPSSVESSNEMVVPDADGRISIVEVTSAPHETPQCYKNLILVCLFMFAFLYQCVEGIPVGFLTTFCAQGLHWHLEQGAVLTMVYCGAQGVGRLLSMVSSWCLTPRTIIICNLTCMLIGYMMLQFVEQLGHQSIWFAMAIAGLGVGSSLPSAFLWVSDYMTMTSAVSATALAGSCVAGVAMLSLTGFLFDALGPMSMVRILGVCSLLFVFTFVIMQLWASYGILLFPQEQNSRRESEKEVHVHLEDNDEKENLKKKKFEDNEVPA